MSPIQRWVRHGHGGVDWVKVLGLGISGAGLVVTLIKTVLVIGTIPTELSHVKEEQERQGRTLEKVLDHVAFGQRGEIGPAPPVDK